MWTGHYYLDYFYYIQFIAQGLRGNWLPRQYFATDDPIIYFHLEPYVVFGQLTRIFRLSPIAAYWLIVLVLTMILSACIFLAIREILKDRTFSIQLCAYLLTIFAGPFFKLVKGITGIQIETYDNWPLFGTFFKRFEPIPHHLLAHIFTIVILLFFADYLRNNENTIAKTFLSALLISGLMIIELSFYPFQVIIIFSAIMLTSFLYFLVCYKKYPKRQKILLFIFICIVGITVLLGGLIIKNIYGETDLFTKIKVIEIAWRSNMSIKKVILSFGPVFLLALLGIKEFAKKINPMKILIFTFALSSILFFYSPLDQILQTHNGRFLSPLNYLFIGSMGGLGLYSISLRAKRFWKPFLTLLIFLFILTSLPPNIRAFTIALSDENLNSPISYLPQGIIEGFKFLSKQSGEGDVLTTPSQFLGSVVSIYVDRKSYVVRYPETPNYGNKNIQTSSFYLGIMTQDQALSFLKKNGIGFVILTSIEGYEIKSLYRYSFLEEIYKNKDIVIFKLKK